MPSHLDAFDKPVGGMSCRHCGDGIVAVGVIRRAGALSISGLREYQWSHEHGSDRCRPTTTAQPFDGWQATTRVEATLAARRAHEEALAVALGDD